MNDPRQFGTFRVDRFEFAVDLRQVRAAIGPIAVSPVPLARPTVAGLVEHDGRVLAAIDPRPRLGLSPARRSTKRPGWILESPAETYCLLVDEIGEVIEMDGADLEPPPVARAGAAANVVLAVGNLPDRLVSVIDPDAFLEPETAPLGQTGA